MSNEENISMLQYNNVTVAVQNKPLYNACNSHISSLFPPMLPLLRFIRLKSRYRTCNLLLYTLCIVWSGKFRPSVFLLLRCSSVWERSLLCVFMWIYICMRLCILDQEWKENKKKVLNVFLTLHIFFLEGTIHRFHQVALFFLSFSLYPRLFSHHSILNLSVAFRISV